MFIERIELRNWIYALIPYFLVTILWTQIYYQQVIEMLGPYTHSHYLAPKISIEISNIFLNYLPRELVTLLILLVFPMIIYTLLVKIFSAYVPVIWAVFMSLIALSIFDGYPFRDFLAGLINGDNLTEFLMPEIVKFPIPQISTLWIITTFYFFEKIYAKNADYLQIIFLSFLSGMTFFINAIDAPFIIIFAISYFVSLLINNKNKNNVIKFLTSIIILFTLSYFAISGIDFDQVNYSTYDFPYYHFIAYFFLPLALITIQYFVFKIDISEVLIRFRHVYLLMISEAIIIFAVSQGYIGLDMEILKSRILQFFFHLYYYIPVIYYATKPVFLNKRDVKRSSPKELIIEITQFLCVKRVYFILMPLICLLLMYNSIRVFY